MPGLLRGAHAVVLALMVAGCSSPQSAPSPSVTFGSAATTPGMPGMSAMPNMSAGSTPSTTAPPVRLPATRSASTTSHLPQRR